MLEEAKRIYEAYGFDISKPLRKLTEITQEEVMIIGQIFYNGNPLKDIDRQGQEEFERIILWPTENLENLITLHANGDITGELTGKSKEYELVNQYLFSIGVERPILTERLKRLL